MAGPSHLKPLPSQHVFSLKSPFPSPTTLSSTKLRTTLLHTFIIPHLCRIARALTRAKSILIEIVKDIQVTLLLESSKKHKNKNKLVFGSFRLHYNWCSSHVLPVPSPSPSPLPTSQVYCEATWNSIISPGCDDIEESQLSGYLHWLEQKVHGDSESSDDINDINKLAELFIANCHEKFLLEKQESYRMFQEMMARSV